MISRPSPPIPPGTEVQHLPEGFRRITCDNDNNLADWLAGHWPVLFRNKAHFSTTLMRAIADDTGLPWCPRVNAAECVLAHSAAQRVEELEVAIDWVAALVDDNDVDPELRGIAVTKLLDFPRARQRVLLQTIAGE